LENKIDFFFWIPKFHTWRTFFLVKKQNLSSP
jgi:hypothetical protein